MTRYPRPFRSALLCFAALAGSSLAWAEDQPAGEAAKKPQTRITVGKDTTYITEPLDKDGYVDYLAAINQMASEGVTPENNAAVPMLKAFGPKCVPEEIRKQYFKMLGVEPLPVEGAYFESFEDYVRRTTGAKFPEGELPAEYAAQWKAAERPWTKEQLPTVAAWLAANERPLALIIEASRKSRRYDPYNEALAEFMRSNRTPRITDYRASDSALRARAMGRIAQGDIPSAWEDLLACHRLAILAAQGRTIVEVLVGYGIKMRLFNAENVILEESSLTAEQSRKMLSDLDRLTPMSSLAEATNTGERYCFLDFCQRMAREGIVRAARLFRPDGEATDPNDLRSSILSASADGLINLNSVMREGNGWCDRIVATMRMPPSRERAGNLCDFDSDLKKHFDERKTAPKFPGEITGYSGYVTRRMSVLFTCMFFAGVTSTCYYEDEARTKETLAKLGFALAAYRAEQGHYPAKLSELVPAYTAQVPLDLYSDKELIYRRTADGYLLYSVGPNLIDDGGRGREDDEAGTGYDDIALRIPPPAPRNESGGRRGDN